jgi:tetratricopeptide (TPR) repeat protein
MLLGRAHYDRKEWTLAIPYYAAASACRRPADGFVQEADYTYAPWDFLGVCLANAGRHDEAIDAALKSLRAGNPERDRIKANLHWSLDQL